MNELKLSELRQSQNLKYWRFAANCARQCVASPWDQFHGACKGDIPSEYDLCRHLNFNHKCCYKFTTSPPTRPSTSTIKPPSSTPEPTMPGTTPQPNPICTAMHGNPIGCRNEVECAFDCGSNKCIDKSEVGKLFTIE